MSNEAPENRTSELVSRNRRFVGIPIHTQPHPSVVLVLYHNRRVCDASIISESLILTAAQCIFGSWHRMTQVMVTTNGLTQKIYNVTNIDYHADYRPSNGVNNIALLKLAEPIDFERGITKVNLPEEFINLADYSKILSYGWIETRNHRTGLLLEVLSSSILPPKKCAQFYGGTAKSLEGTFCVQSNEEYQIVHQMTGGPAMVGKFQVGVVISERFCNRTTTFFTKVDTYRDWIDAAMSRLMESKEYSSAFYPLSKTELDYAAEYYGESISEDNGFFTVAIVNIKNGSLICAGSVVAKDMVLTTARCAKKFSHEKMRARVFSKKFIKGFKDYKIAKVHIHKSFRMKPFPNVNDIALLQTKADLTANGVAQKIELIGRDEKIQPPMLGEVYGFFNRSNIMQVGALFIDKDECNWIYEKAGGWTGGTICAKSHQGWCNHAAGEPFMVEGRLVGILSASSQECADFRVPGIFIDVTENLAWINKKLYHLNEIEEGLR
ncbi:hypothetical protein QAD02_006955 [Eretmocerus hayati]|uniref:Uncharacterized protein n=1 Tax=Eretmocerus hayati TaxID=131215 RepID=A0ACC2N2S3_9HYME|nr:hypothetical protein QAD02_006955 [Eretmocerus hayati]